MRTLKRTQNYARAVVHEEEPKRTKKGGIVEACIVLFGYEMEYDDGLLPDDRPSPEQTTIKNDLYSKLSDDAKEVITTVFNSPKEFMDACIIPSNGRFRVFRGDSSYYVRKFFRKKWRSRLKVKRAFKEVEKYLRKIK